MCLLAAVVLCCFIRVISRIACCDVLFREVLVCLVLCVRVSVVRNSLNMLCVLFVVFVFIDLHAVLVFCMCVFVVVLGSFNMFAVVCCCRSYLSRACVMLCVFLLSRIQLMCAVCCVVLLS